MRFQRNCWCSVVENVDTVVSLLRLPAIDTDVSGMQDGPGMLVGGLCSGRVGACILAEGPGLKENDKSSYYLDSHATVLVLMASGIKEVPTPPAPRARKKIHSLDTLGSTVL